METVVCIAMGAPGRGRRPGLSGCRSRQCPGCRPGYQRVPAGAGSRIQGFSSPRNYGRIPERHLGVLPMLALPGLHGWIQQLPEPVYGAVLAATSRREVAAANAVYELGSPADACYLIEAGRVRKCGGNQHQQCHRHRNDDRDHTDVPVGLFVGQLGNCEHGDYRAAVGE